MNAPAKATGPTKCKRFLKEIGWFRSANSHRARSSIAASVRGHLTEYGCIAPKGPSHVTMLADLLEEEEMANSLPEAACTMFRLMLDLLAGLDGKIAALDKEIARRAREDEVSRMLMTVPGVGPI